MMLSKRWQKELCRSLGVAIVVATAAPLAIQCGGMPKAPGAPNVPGAPKIPGAPNCPDLSTAEAVGKVDFVKEFGLEAAASQKLGASLTAAVSIHALSAQVDADLKGACGGLAKDLGAGGDYPTGQAACEGAIKAMQDTRAKMGATAKVAVDVIPPRCAASMDAMAECSGKCDAKVDPGKAKVECEGGEVSGECGGKCDGHCEASGGATCEGSCEGACEGNFSGNCDGTCNGKCAGKNSTGSCAGKCEGTCEGNAKGQCKGKCQGGCKLKGSAECKGTCSGKCSVAFKEPKCSGEIKPPKVSADCKASCDAQVSAKVDCTPARVAVVIEGAADASVSKNYKAAIEKNLPGVLKIAIGMEDRLKSVSAKVQASVEGSQDVVKAAAGAGAKGAQLTSCVAAPFRAAGDAAGSLKANVNVSVEVKASASASGSASGKAKG